jgi:aryl-alcohol dehydrogenase-like predicted oxidoreductase
MNSIYRLGLGTVQWGMQYGVTNTAGKPPIEEVKKILHLAKVAGVDLLDTAWAYGDAQDVIGQTCSSDTAFQVVTKTRPLKGLDVIGADVALTIENAFKDSSSKLQRENVYGLIVHHADDLLGANGPTLWRVLEKLKAEGFVQKIGCSLYQPEQFFALQQRYALDLIQVPFNIYDQRYVASGMADVAKAKGVEVHSRSAFLQGILLCPPSNLPIQNAQLDRQHIALWKQYEMTSMTPVQAALGFCLACPHIDRVLVGCAELSQLEQAIAVAGKVWPIHHFEQFASLAITDESIINPSNWMR